MRKALAAAVAVVGTCAFFLLGGIEALVIRAQLMLPGMNIVSGDLYNGMFTMHATTMIFLVVMPMSAAFFNYIIPLQIGARDVAFPRLNAFSYWTFLVGGLIVNGFFEPFTRELPMEYAVELNHLMALEMEGSIG